MREYTGELAGRELKLAANFKASVELAEKVGDPLMISREAFLEAMMVSNNLPYEPKWSFTIHNVPHIIHIGLKAAGDKTTLEEVQELVFEAGFFKGREVAEGYLALIVGPTPEEVGEQDEKASEGN